MIDELEVEINSLLEIEGWIEERRKRLASPWIREQDGGAVAPTPLAAPTSSAEAKGSATAPLQERAAGQP